MKGHSRTGLIIAGITVFALMSPAVLFAQELVEREGAKAISFGFDRFRIEAFGVGMGGKYWISQNVALQGSIDVLTARNEEEEKFSGGTVTVDDSDSFNGGGATIGFEKHFKSFQSLSPYLGMQASFFKFKEEYDFIISPSQKATNHRRVTEYGLGAVFGAEFWFSKNLSLSAQHTLGVTFYEAHFKGGSSFSGSTDSEEKGHEFGNGVSRLALSFYF